MAMETMAATMALRTETTMTALETVQTTETEMMAEQTETITETETLETTMARVSSGTNSIKF